LGNPREPAAGVRDAPDGRWWPDVAVRIAVGVALIALLGFAVAEGVIPGATFTAQIVVIPLLALLVVGLGTARGVLRMRSGRPSRPWWRAGAVTAAMVAFLAYPWLVLPVVGTVPLRVNLAASQDELEDVAARIFDAGTVPAGLPVIDTSDLRVVGEPVWIGGFHVTGIAASCAGSAARLARHECAPDEFGVEFRITWDDPGDPSNTATDLVYCTYPDCEVVTSGSGGSIQLKPHWAVGFEYAVGASVFFVVAMALTGCWLAVVLIHIAARLALRARPTR
jgi:hypothetical protein